MERPLAAWPALLVVLSGLCAAPLTAQGGADCPICDEAAALVRRLELPEARRPVRERPGWAPPRRIVVAFGGDSLATALRSVAPAADIVVLDGPSATAAALREADVLLGGPCDSAALEAGSSLRWIQAPSAGVERCALSELRQRGILLTNAQRLYGPPIAEHVIGMMLAFSRALPAYVDAQRDGRWDPAAGTGNGRGAWIVEGKTMLVVGLGGIGTEVARRAHGLGMRVLATRNSSREGPDFVEYVGLADEAVTLAGRADVVVDALPLTDETRGLFDAAFFAAMKPTAIFINVGRGGTVATDDLVRALRSGEIAGAGLDVTDPEPLPPHHPLWTTPNVLITPHVASDADDIARRLTLLFVENLRRYVAGDRMVSVVDLERGY